MALADRRIDCVMEMLDELRGESMPVFDVDRRERWFDAAAQLVGALPKRDQQWAWVDVIAHDLCDRMPVMVLACAVAYVRRRLNLREDTHR